MKKISFVFLSTKGSYHMKIFKRGGLSTIRLLLIGLAAVLCAPSAYAGTTTSISFDIDIKFCSNPNAHNCRSGGVLPVTIFGADDFDVRDIDLDSLQLCRLVGAGCTPFGSVIDSSIADRGDPNSDLGASQCAIDPDTGEELDFLNPDGFLDLDAAFDKRAVSDLLDVCAGGSKNDSSVTLFILGSLLDGTPISSFPIGNNGIDQLVRKNR